MGGSVTTLTVATAFTGPGSWTQIASGTLNIGGTSTIALTSTASNNIVNYTGGTQTLVLANYYHLNISGGAKTFTAATQVAGNMSLSSSSTITTVTGLTISGNLTINDGCTFSTGRTHAFTVSGNTTVGNGVSGSLVNTGTTGTAAIKTFSGDVTVNVGATWTQATCQISIGGSLQNLGTFTSGTGLYFFTGITKTISGTLSIPSVQVDGSCTNNGALTIATALSGAGSLTQGSGSSLTITGTNTITTLDAFTNTNTVTYNGTTQNIHATSYDTLVLGVLNTSQTKTFETGSITINRLQPKALTTVKFFAGSTYTYPTYTDTDWDGNATNKVIFVSTTNNSPYYFTNPTGMVLRYISLRDCIVSSTTDVEYAINAGHNGNFTFGNELFAFFGR
jgi:hypothetical protein